MSLLPGPRAGHDDRDELLDGLAIGVHVKTRHPDQFLWLTRGGVECLDRCSREAFVSAGVHHDEWSR